jgi:phosphotransferase system HPr-like phosphotransfer protein
MIRLSASIPAFLVFTLALTLTISPANADTWRDQINLKTTEFTNELTLMGKPKEQGETGDRYTYVMFAAVHKKTGEFLGAGFGVMNTYQSKGWRRWNSAATSQAEQLELTGNGSDRRLCNSAGCFFDESVTIMLSQPTLRKAAAEPMQIRMAGRARGAEFTLDIDPREAQALLEAIEETGTAARKDGK